jgi:hypothetical protein
VPTYPLRSCLSLCNTDPNVGAFNDQIWSGQFECLTEQPCELLASGVGQQTCLEAAREALVPSDACIDFCLTDAAASFECAIGYSVEACVTGPTCSFDDAVFSLARACDDMDDCDARAACVAKAFIP